MLKRAEPDEKIYALAWVTIYNGKNKLWNARIGRGQEIFMREGGPGLSIIPKTDGE